MDPELKTEGIKNYLENSFTILNIFQGDERYVYRVKSKEKTYILKGFKIAMQDLTSINEGAKLYCIEFYKILEKILNIYQEYCYAKIACTFCPHFAKPLLIGYKLELAESKAFYNHLYIEILFEYGGESIDTLRKIKLSQAYELMRQSANAISLLHNMGIMHFDIKPENMVYTETKDKKKFLKIIDMGSAYGEKTKSKIYAKTESIDDKLREFTEAFAPPEVLDNNDQSRSFCLGKFDVYSWALCFFSLLVGRSIDNLSDDVERRKNTKKYEYYMNEIVNPEFQKIKAETKTEKKIKEQLNKILITQLNYDPNKRSTMSEIVTQMKNFEQKENIRIAYKIDEEKYRMDVMKLFGFDQKKNTEINSLSVCQNCIKGKNAQMKLKCNHTVCMECVLKSIMERFKSGIPYKNLIFCDNCKEEKEINSVLINSEWKSFDENIEEKCEINDNDGYQGKLDIAFMDLYFINYYKKYYYAYYYTKEYMKSHQNNLKLCNLRLKNIGDGGAKAIAELLKFDKNVKELYIHANEITSEGAEEISELLNTNIGLNELNISSNKIRDKGAVMITNSLRQNEHIKKLLMSDNELGIESARGISNLLVYNKRIDALDISWNNIGDEGAGIISESLIVNKGLNILNMTNNGIGNRGATSIADALKCNSGLIELNLSANNIGYEGAKSLGISLEINRTLVKLVLNINNIQDEGAKAIANSLIENKTLTVLNLGQNKIGNSIVKDISELLMKNSTLIELNLNGNKMSTESEESIAISLKNNKSIMMLRINDKNLKSD